MCDKAVEALNKINRTDPETGITIDFKVRACYWCVFNADFQIIDSAPPGAAGGLKYSIWGWDLEIGSGPVDPRIVLHEFGHYLGFARNHPLREHSGIRGSIMAPAVGQVEYPLHFAPEELRALYNAAASR